MTERWPAAALKEYLAKSASPVPSKYRAKPVNVDGIRFDSKREARYWCNLQLRVKAGEIKDLERQVVVFLEGRDGPVLTRKGRPMRITLDFGYTVVATEKRELVDAKGMPTRDYEVRRAVAAAQGVEVIEV